MAILSDEELKGNLVYIYNGDDVAKGVLQYTDIIWNYRGGSQNMKMDLGLPN